MASVKVNVPGIEETRALITKHLDLIQELEDNLRDIRQSVLSIEVNINQSSNSVDD